MTQQSWGPSRSTCPRHEIQSPKHSRPYKVKTLPRPDQPCCSSSSTASSAEHRIYVPVATADDPPWTTSFWLYTLALCARPQRHWTHSSDSNARPGPWISAYRSFVSACFPSDPGCDPARSSPRQHPILTDVNYMATRRQRLPWSPLSGHAYLPT